MLKAVVVLKPDETSRAVTPEALMAFTAERVAPYKRIRRVEFVDQMPTSASGKIRRRTLVERDRAVPGTW